jgi:hypothetical protein
MSASLIPVADERNDVERGNVIDHKDLVFCDLCTAFQTREYTLFEEVFTHHLTLDNLRKSTEQGCEMCRVVLGELSQVDKIRYVRYKFEEFKDSEAIALKLRYRWNYNPPGDAYGADLEVRSPQTTGAIKLSFADGACPIPCA